MEKKAYLLFLKQMRFLAKGRDFRGYHCYCQPEGQRWKTITAAASALCLPVQASAYCSMLLE